MLEEMKKMIAEQLSCDENEINLETSFKDDLGADSLDLFELVMALGYLDREMQLRQLDVFEEELCRRLDFLACQLPEKKKLCRNLGILGGIFLGVLLW